MSVKRSDRVKSAAFMLYATNVLGILNLFSSGAITKNFSPLLFLDIGAYCLLFVLAVLIHLQVKVAQILYVLVAVVWYVALVFYLPFAFGHSLDFFFLFLQVMLIVLAFGILNAPLAPAELAD